MTWLNMFFGYNVCLVFLETCVLLDMQGKRRYVCKSFNRKKLMFLAVFPFFRNLSPYQVSMSHD